MARLGRGERVAVVSDAGMPGISDPGERLVRGRLAAGHAVEVVPGPSAALAALVTSGLPAGRFVFEGFLLARAPGGRSGWGRSPPSRARSCCTRRPTGWPGRSPTSPSVRPDRRVAVARELTKLHEEVWRGSLGDALAWARRGRPGEIVLVLEGAPAAGPPHDGAVVDRARAELAAGATARDAARALRAASASPAAGSTSWRRGWRPA